MCSKSGPRPWASPRISYCSARRPAADSAAGRRQRLSKIGGRLTPQCSGRRRPRPGAVGARRGSNTAAVTSSIPFKTCMTRKRHIQYARYKINQMLLTIAFEECLQGCNYRSAHSTK